MKSVCACLARNWVRLNDDPECTIGEEHLSPSEWVENGTPIWSSNKSYRALGYLDQLQAQGIDDPVAHFQKEVDSLNAQ